MITDANKLVGLDPRMRDVAMAFCTWLSDLGFHVTITSGRRSTAKQRQLYERYLRGESKLLALPPGRSLHEHGLAWDMVINGQHPPREIGEIWKSIGGQWGGDVNDPVHFQVKQLRT